MALASSPRFDIALERARLKAVSWESQSRAGVLSNSDAELVQRVSGGNSEVIRPEQEEDYAALYARLLDTINRNEVRSSVLALLADFVAVDGRQDERVKLLNDRRPHESLMKLLDSPEDFLRNASTAILCILLGADSDADDETINQLLSHLGRQLGSSGPGDSDAQLIAAQCLAALLRRHDARTAAWSREQPQSDSKGKSNGDKQSEPKVIAPLVTILRSLLPTSSNGNGSGSSTPNTAAGQQIALQLQYHAGFSIWLLSYDKSFCEGINKAHPQLFSTLVELARHAAKEKIVRVVMATLRNLVEKAPDANLAALLNAKTPAYLTQLQQSRRWGDEDIRNDADFLAEQLKDAKQKLTTYDEYVAELESGELSWTPPHEDSDFWRENADKLNKKDQEQLKALVNILQTAREPLVLSVALNDVGQYVRHCDDGKKNIEKLGGKSRAMELLQHPDADVKYRALTAVQNSHGLLQVRETLRVLKQQLTSPVSDEQALAHHAPPGSTSAHPLLPSSSSPTVRSQLLQALAPPSQPTTQAVQHNLPLPPTSQPPQPTTQVLPQQLPPPSEARFQLFRPTQPFAWPSMESEESRRGSMSSTDEPRPSSYGVRRVPKTNRRRTTKEQNDILEPAFARNAYVTGLSQAERDEIIAATGMSEKRIIDWWRNRRTRANRDGETLVIPEQARNTARSFSPPASRAPAPTRAPARSQSATQPSPPRASTSSARASGLTLCASGPQQQTEPTLSSSTEQPVIYIPSLTLTVGEFTAEVDAALDWRKRLLVYRYDTLCIDVAISALTSIYEFEGGIELEMSWPPRLRGDEDLTDGQTSMNLRHELVFKDTAQLSAALDALKQPNATFNRE